MKSRLKLLAALSLLFSLASPALAQELTPEQRQQIAHKIVTLSAKVKPHEVVLIEGNAVFLPFMEDLAIEASKVGGYAIFRTSSDRFLRAVFTEVPEEYYGQPDPTLPWFKNIDVRIQLPPLYNQPEVFRGVPPARLAKLQANGADEFRAGVRQTKTRSIFVDAPLPDQAASFGFDFATYANMQWQAIGADYASIEQSGRRLSDMLARAANIHVTAPDGTDFTFRPGQQPPLAYGGITRPDAPNWDDRAATLPGGVVVLPLAPGSFQGKIFTPEDYCNPGEKITGVSYQFHDGKMTGFTAQQNAKCLQDYLDAYAGSKDLVASVQVGLNPNLRSQSRTAPSNQAGMLWVNLGRDDRLGVSGTQMYWAIPVVSATVDVDGRTVVKSGQLRLP